MSLLSLLMALAASLIFIFLATSVMVKRGWMIDVITRRSNHRNLASRGGGTCLLVVVTFTMLMAIGFGMPPPPPLFIMVLCAGALGVLDDVTTMTPLTKLGLMVLLSMVMAQLVGPLQSIPMPMGNSIILPQGGGIFLSSFMILAFVNIYNFMDGLNGMAGSAGVIGLTFLVMLGAGGSAGLFLLLFVTATALYGFTIRNVLTGRIFLGDAGSLSLGFLLIGSALYAHQTDSYTLYVFLIAFLPFIIDTTVTLFRRWRMKKSIFNAHKEHFYQKLRLKGYSHQAVSATYGAMILINGAVAYSLSHGFGGGGLWIAAIFAIGLYAVSIRLLFQKAASKGAPILAPSANIAE
ncbi:MAG: hypothetical protein AAF603_00715 [Pseudomonadota bacterium]